MTFALRWLARAAFALIALPLLLAAWVGFALVSTLPQLQGEHRLEGIGSAAQIARDEFGVPHITAKTARDAYFALGYAHAQDRFFQMDMTRRSAEGRLAEVLGDIALRADAQTRIKGLHLAVTAQTKRLAPQTRALLQAYADGVNARLARGGVSAEHRMLLMRVDRWRVEDSVAVAVALTDLLTSGEQFDVADARFKFLTPAQRAIFFPAYPDWALDSVGATIGAVAATTSAAPASPGSNAWALSGARTKSGKPLLAGDPHLSFGAPAQFYLADMRWRDQRRVGFTIPGAPFLVFGHNGALAWAVTNNEIDAADITPDQPDAPHTSRTETIRVRTLFGAPRLVRIVAADVGGAVRIDADYFNLSAFGGKPMLYRDLAMERDNDVVNALAALNAARTMDAFAAALNGWRAPLVHLSAASTSGEIALFAAGDAPLRGADGAWIGRVDASARLAIRDPPGGVLAAANNIAQPLDRTRRGAFDPYRVTRIHDLLADGESTDVDSAARMQMDVGSPFAMRVLPTLLRTKATSAAARGALRLLRTWDGSMDAARPEPLIFAAWIEALSRAIYEDELGDDLYAAYAGPRLQFVEAVLGRDDGHWCDRRASALTETCADLLAPSLEQAVAKLRRAYGPNMKRWRWSAAHQAQFAHPLMTAAPVFNTLFDVRAPIGGSADTISVGAYWHGNGFTAVHGPSVRAVFDLGDLDRSRFVIAPGQSANPLSPHYRDLVSRWAVNRGFELNAASAKTRVLTLAPRR